MLDAFTGLQEVGSFPQIFPLTMMNPVLPSKSPPLFTNGESAGRNLAKHLGHYANCGDVMVLAIPTSSVPLAAAMARSLKAPFDVLLVGKISMPGRTSHVIGAVTGGGVRMLNYELIDRLELSDSEVSDAILKASLELARREQFYHGLHPSLEVADQTVILVDDGTTPRGTLRDAIRLLRRQHADQIVMALLAERSHAAWDLRLEADEVVILAEPVMATGQWIKSFSRTTAAGVRRMLSGRRYGTHHGN